MADGADVPPHLPNVCKEMRPGLVRRELARRGGARLATTWSPPSSETGSAALKEIFMSASRWPVDFEQLEKGSIISVEQIESKYGYKAGSDDYQFALMHLTREITRYFETRKHMLVMVVSDKGNIRILRDDEAAIKTDERLNSKIDAACELFRVQLAVDTRNLNAEEISTHERRVINNGKQIQALAKAGVHKALIVHRRTLPGLPNNALAKGEIDVQGTEVQSEGNQSAAAPQRASG
jgi:hypothetical protein